MKELSILLERAREAVFFCSCFKARGEGGEGVEASHLLFADDTLVFCKDSQDQMFHLSWLLMWFDASLRLKIDLDKSELIPI